MTDKDYDPFTYGQLRMPAGSNAGGESPEDLLFSTSSPSPGARTDARDLSWDPPSSTASELSALDFDADILGEQAPMVRPKVAAPAKVAAAAPKPAAPRPAAAKPTAKATGKPTGQPTLAPAAASVAPSTVGAARTGATTTVVGATAATLSESKVTTAKPVAARPRTVPAIDPRSMPDQGKASVAVPLLILAVGGAAAVWFQYGRQNAVMAGIAGALSMALAGVAWFGLRR